MKDKDQCKEKGCRKESVIILDDKGYCQVHYELELERRRQEVSQCPT